MELTKEIKEILEDIVWWETCPTDYKFKINAYLKSVNESEALSIHDVSKCACPPLVACEICGEEKNLDGDFWKNKKKHDC